MLRMCQLEFVPCAPDVLSDSQLVGGCGHWWVWSLTKWLFYSQETDVIVSQVLDELGISLDQELSQITPGLDKPHIQVTQTVRDKLIIIIIIE